MTDRPRSTPEWLPGLVAQVEQATQLRSAEKHDRRPAQEQELLKINENVAGWSQSLAKPSLPALVRETIEKSLDAAVRRRSEIEAEIRELETAAASVERLVQADEVLERLDKLADVLAANDPTRGNLELSLHIDRIVCSRDGTARLRLCRLGIAPEAVRTLSPPVAPKPDDDSRARRRGRLRVVDDDTTVDLSAQASYVADTHRFAGLSDDWFWTDTFHVPGPTSWASENAERVFRRRQESKLSYARLAAEFGVTPPTIRAAIERYLATHADEKDGVKLQCGGKRPPKFDLQRIADEARTLRLGGQSLEKLAKRYKCSSPTVVKAIELAYAQEGLSMPSRAELRRRKADEARRLLDQGFSLEQIAASMKISDVTARQYLRDAFAAEGRPAPDLRRRPRP